MRSEDASNDYVIRVFDEPGEIDAAQWNALVDAQPSATPFMRLEYLRALHDSASASDATGWTPQFLALTERGALLAACPLYLKSHSYGEYVFDWAWADAYQRHGLRYYPKLLDAVPFTPVPGPRLLARDAGRPPRAAARRCSSWRATRSCRRRTCCFSTTPTRRPRALPAG